jgi:hypothetical protein
MRRKRRPWALAATLAAFMTGCGELPHPFQHEGPAPLLARPLAARMIAIDPPPGPDRPARALAQALATELLRRDRPAVVGAPPPGADRLSATLDRTDGHAILDWTLTGPDQNPPPHVRQPAPWDDAGTPPPDAAAQAEAARRIADALLGEPPSPAAPPAPSTPPPSVSGAPMSGAPLSPRQLPRVRLLPLADLPGDGAQALPRALKLALERSGLLVVAGDADFLVAGKIALSAAPDGDDRLSVSWTVERPDGTALGTIAQNGPVPPGRLSQAWGDIAGDIADGGADGILQVIAAAGHKHN